MHQIDTSHMTGEQLHAEDKRVLASLSARQWVALNRQAEARRYSRFGSQTVVQRLQTICNRDAAKMVEAAVQDRRHEIERAA